MTRSSDKSLLGLILEAEDLASLSKAKVTDNLHDLQTKFLGPRSLLFILTNPAKVIPKLEEQEWSRHRLCAMVNAPLSVFKRAEWLQKEYADEWKVWQDKRQETQKAIDDNYEKNEGTERFAKSAIPWSKVLEIRDELPKGSVERLLVCFYTMIPPVRSNYGNLLIYRKVPKEEDVPEQQNYIVLTKDDNYIGLRRYKTRKHYNEIITKIPDELVDEIEESLRQEPRTHMFVGRDDKPFNSENSFTKFTTRAFEKIYNKPGLSINIFRRMYVSKPEDCLQNKSWAEKKEVAKAMGNSVEVQERIYFVKKEFNKVTFSSDSDSD